MQQIVQTSKCWHIVLTDSFVMFDNETYKLDILIWAHSNIDGLFLLQSTGWN